MKKIILLVCFILLLVPPVFGNETVVLLHGLTRTSRSMKKMESALSKEGYVVININYPSTKYKIEELSDRIRKEILQKTEAAEQINFVTHSMGGILLRYIQSHNPFDNIGRVVMLSPPNQGSQVVDVLGGIFLFKWINGPAGLQLGTKEAKLQNQNIIERLGKVDFELGIITGDRSINGILSTIIPGPDDGKVAIDYAKVEGMKEFKVVHANHTYIMQDKGVIKDVLNFLKHGTFYSE